MEESPVTYSGGIDFARSIFLYSLMARRKNRSGTASSKPERSLELYEAVSSMPICATRMGVVRLIETSAIVATFHGDPIRLRRLDRESVNV